MVDWLEAHHRRNLRPLPGTETAHDDFCSRDAGFRDGGKENRSSSASSGVELRLVIWAWLSMLRQETVRNLEH